MSPRRAWTLVLAGLALSSLVSWTARVAGLWWLMFLAVIGFVLVLVAGLFILVLTRTQRQA
ncbi:hypothetical protein [uncultured Aeromicrobium sp.]|uniref:hypothetical protein n=1 Tax=uncultured Aeromicrobium sp. TaxID=337820 RepID=UPI0025D3158A|nr:hypothetical protein [uncultured Aeromicrobium sp.]